MTARAPWIGVGVALILVAAAMLIPFATGWQVYVDLPPLHAVWWPRLGWGTVPAIVVGALAVRFAIDLATRLSWRALLAATFGAALVWMLCLAAVDGLDGIQSVLLLKSEYLRTARAVTDVSATLHEYISRIPLDSDQHWPVHIAGHPPGALLFFVGLVRVGLGSGLAAGVVVTVLAATTPVAVLLTLRRLGAEVEARTAAPFLAIGTAAIWMAVSADAMFGAFAAWGLCCLAFAATSRRVVAVGAWGLASGAQLGWCVMLSYGLPLLGVLAVAVLVAARSWRPLPWAVGSAVAVVLGFAVAGFAWWQAYPVLATRYWEGIAAVRPFGYWVWADLAALVFSAGPIVGASVSVVIANLPAVRERIGGSRVIVLLVVAAAASIVLADLSGMSKAEVERIWLPFVPWLLIGTALLTERWRRVGIGIQVLAALIVQHLFFTTW